MEKTQAVNIYKEKILIKQMFLAGILAAIFFSATLYWGLTGKLVGFGFIVPVSLCLSILATAICFSHLFIKITPYEVFIGWRIFNRSISMESIEGYSVLESPPPLMTGAFSTRWGEFKGRKYIAYDLLGTTIRGTSRIILHLKKGEDIAFPTKKPKEVAQILDKYLSQK